MARNQCRECGARTFLPRTIRIVEVWGKWEAHIIQNCRCGRSWVLKHLPPGTAYVLGRQYGTHEFKFSLLKQYEGTAAFECHKRDRGDHPDQCPRGTLPIRDHCPYCEANLRDDIDIALSTRASMTGDAHILACPGCEREYIIRLAVWTPLVYMYTDDTNV